MHASGLIWRLAATVLPELGAAGAAFGQTGTFLALQTNAVGIFSYVRRAEFEAFADASPYNHILILTGLGV